MNSFPRVLSLHTDLVLAFCLRALGLVTINHAYLGDYDQPNWFIVRVITTILGIMLVFTPQAISSRFHLDHFKLSAIISAILCLTKIYTLFFLRDVLTQSLLLAMYFLIIAISAGRAKERLSLLLSLSMLSASTYLLAIIHKLNFDFLYTAHSCAIHGYQLALSLFPASLITDLSKIGLLNFLESYPSIASLTVIGLEWSIALLCWRRHKFIWCLGGLFHLPLTLTIAPSFGSVMAIGWGAGTMIGSRTARQSKLMKLTLISKHQVCLCLYFTHGLLSPYLGIEVQHSAAMLSNLRVDPKCNNSIIFQTASHDPYLYIDEVSFGQNPRPQRVQRLKKGLWSPSALNTMRKNWCIKEQRPLKMQGRYLSQPFLLEDLCEQDALDIIYQRSNLPIKGTWQRFQKNLQKSCHQACIH